MHWLGYLAIFVVSFSIKDVIRKRSLNRFENMAVLSLEFSSVFLIFLLLALVFKIPLEFNSYTLTFLGIGVLHGFGTVGKVNAMNVSLSKTALLSKYNIFLPMLLGYFLLGESSLFGFDSLAGVLKIIALVIFPISLYLMKNKGGEKNGKISKEWLVGMIQFFVFHAPLFYLIKSNINSDLIIQAAVFQRFSAAAIAVGFATINKTKFPLTKQLFGVSSFNGVLIAISFFATLSALTTAPLVIYKPLEKMSTLIIITFFGLFVFGEHKEINKRSKWGYLITGLGVILLIVAEVLELMG